MIPTKPTVLLPLLACATLGLWALPIQAAPLVYAAGEGPHDVRLGQLKDLDGYFPFTPSPDRESWTKRAGELRTHILVALGLWPLPERTPLNPVVHGRKELGDYTVEKVYFESMPGFYVTGNLYRPAGGSGPFPAVLSPHGHWENGRFYDTGEKQVREDIITGAERFENGGRSPLQSRCVQLARMGCVVFHYDMIGYADSQQISEAVAHRFAKQRPEMNHPEGWGLFSPAAEAHLQSVMGLQTWNSIRALDFLLSLDGVDTHRIGVTGASGGGTQTFILCAVDDRPTAAFPAVMVSTAMQGGCTCENCCLLRVGTGNVEFAALFAPKPLGMTAANDWTKEMPTKGYPELQSHYALWNARDQVELTPLLHFGHNYNYVSRAAMYRWFNKHLQLGLEAPIVEQDYHRLNRDELSVWDAAHPQPPGGPDFERNLLKQWHESTQDAIRQSLSSPAAFQALAGPGVRAVIGRTLPPPKTVRATVAAPAESRTPNTFALRIRLPSASEEVPALLLRSPQSNGRTVIWLDPAGKSGCYAPDGQPRAEVQSLLDAGINVVAVDLLFQGESLGNQPPITQTRTVSNPREAAAYTFGYNHSLFAQRVHDVLTVAAWLKSNPAELSASQEQQLGLLGFGEAALWAAAARAVNPETFHAAAIHTGAFRFGNLTDLRDPRFLPGGAQYLDLPGMIALGGAQSLWLAGEGSQRRELPQPIRRAFRESRQNLTVPSEAAATPATAAAWLATALH